MDADVYARRETFILFCNNYLSGRAVKYVYFNLISSILYKVKPTIKINNKENTV